MQHADYLLMGGGVASVQAAEAIRSRDPSGTIAIVGDEPNPPTDRPPLSKQFMKDNSWTPEDTESRGREFYADNNIELLTGHRVEAIQRAGKQVILAGGVQIGYGKLLIATGASARRLSAPGANLEGVAALRSVSDAVDLRRRLQGARRVVIVGHGFIGMEVAAASVARGIETIAIGPSDRPHSGYASAPFGRFLADYFRSKGVELLYGDTVSALVGNGRLERVRTANGIDLRTGLAVVGIGATLNTQPAVDAGLEVDGLAAVCVDQFLRTADPAIWAAGDVAAFPDAASGRTRHVEHFMNAKWQGEVAGANMAGDPQPYDRVAYIYSDIFDLHLNIRGDGFNARSVAVLGDLPAGEFVELFADADGVLKMTVAVSRDDSKLDGISDVAESLLRQRVLASSVQAATFGL